MQQACDQTRPCIIKLALFTQVPAIDLTNRMQEEFAGCLKQRRSEGIMFLKKSVGWAKIPLKDYSSANFI